MSEMLGEIRNKLNGIRGNNTEDSDDIDMVTDL